MDRVVITQYLRICSSLDSGCAYGFPRGATLQLCEPSARTNLASSAPPFPRGAPPKSIASPRLVRSGALISRRGWRGFRRQRDFVPIGWLDTQQIVYEIIIAVMLGAQHTDAVSLARMKSMSKCLFAFTSAFTTCNDDAGSTLSSISPTMMSALPCSRCALSTLEEAA